MAVLATFARVYVDDLDAALAALAASGWTRSACGSVTPPGCASRSSATCSSSPGPTRSSRPSGRTQLTVVVDDLDAPLAAARSAGTETVREPAEQEVGRNATVSFPAGPVIEYVEWNPATRAAAGL